MAAPYFGVSNMTYRRWQMRPEEDVDDVYLGGIYKGLYAMVADGFLSLHAKDVQALVQYDSQPYLQAVLKSFSVEENVGLHDHSPESMMSMLQKIGASNEKRQPIEFSGRDLLKMQIAQVASCRLSFHCVLLR